jgi:hypothetical protein
MQKLHIPHADGYDSDVARHEQPTAPLRSLFCTPAMLACGFTDVAVRSV